MGSVNKVIILGRLGADPEVRYTQDQTPVASFNVATSINYKNKSGEKVDKTSWHRCVAWRKTGEIIGQYFKKGNQIYIEGSLESRSYEDKSGEKNILLEILLIIFRLLILKVEAQLRPMMITSLTILKLKVHLVMTFHSK